MRALRSWFGILGAFALALVPAPAGAQAVGSEFQINTYTTDDQRTPHGGSNLVAADVSGNFVVVWHSLGQDGSGFGIFGQRYDSAGMALGTEFSVNSWTTDHQAYTSVAAASDGDFIVVWDSRYQDGSQWGIFGQRYDSGGVAQGAEFHVNSYTTSFQVFPSVTSDANGNFVVVWDSRYQDGSQWGIFGQRYDSVGVAQGAEFRVNTYTEGHQRNSSIASDASGNFVVVWQSDAQDGSSYGIFGQRYASGGVAQGDEFRVNSYTTSYQMVPSVASDASGNFVVVWHGSDGYAPGIFGQRYDSAGVALGDEFLVNTYTPHVQAFPSVASDASGNFVVAWNSYYQDGSSYGIFGQSYDGAGVAQGNEFQINSFTTGHQRNPSVGATGTNQFVVAWGSNYTNQDGSGSGVFGQRLDFGLPSLSISDVSVNEGNVPGRTTRTLALFAVTLSAPSTQPVAIDYATADGTALAPSDYRPISGTLTLSPGQTSLVIAVVVKGDNLPENDEAFFVNLSNPVNATIADGQGVGTIQNDDP